MGAARWWLLQRVAGPLSPARLPEVAFLLRMAPHSVDAAVGFGVRQRGEGGLIHHTATTLKRIESNRVGTEHAHPPHKNHRYMGYRSDRPQNRRQDLGFLTRMEGPSEIPAGMDFPEVKILEQKWYSDKKIPAWMDFPEEEEEEGDSEEEEGDSEEVCSEEEEWKWKEDIFGKIRRRKMCIAWILASKEFSKNLNECKEKETEEMSKERERREEIMRTWGEFSADEKLKVGWKVSEMKRLNKIWLEIWMKKLHELELAYVMKQQRKEAQEKGVWPDMELKKTSQNYLDFRNRWTAIHSSWGGVFEDRTKICHMGYTDDPVPRYVYNFGPPDTLQIFSVKVEGSLGGIDCFHWPLHVFGLVALRDSIDQHRNVIFDRTRDECQILTKEDPYLVLTGPTRVVVMNDESIPVTIEAELKVKGTDGSKDKYLIFAAAPLPPQFCSGSFELTNGKYSKLKIALGRIMACVEASIFIRVTDGTWPAGFHGQIAAHTSSINEKEVVLVEFVGDVPVSDGNVDQSRFVVSVEAFGELMVSYKAWKGDEAMEDEVAFKPEKKGRSYGTLKVGSCILEILVAWSPIRPVCEELVSMSELEYA